MGGAAGDSNAVGYNIGKANTYRPYVNDAYGFGDYHGFDTTISVEKTGTQPVYVYAINVGGGSNTLIGTGNVTISPRETNINVWISDTAMGDVVNTCEVGKAYYLCFRVYDKNSGDLYNSYSQSTYTATETVYDPNGNTHFTHSYDNSDNNWIKFTPNSSGVWKGEVNLTGDITGGASVSVSVLVRNSLLETWISESDMGAEITEYYVETPYYLCYKLYDSNTGDYFNSYSNYSYTVKVTFYDENGNEVGNHEFTNSDRASISFHATKAGECSYKVSISGDILAEETKSFEVKDEIISATGVNLSKNAISLNVGDTTTLTAFVLPSNATNKTVTWSSSDTSVATVNNGTVTAVKAGTSIITVTTADGSKAASCVVTVIDPTVSVTGITLNKTTATLTVGDTTTLTATVAPSNATNKTVTWSSSDTSVATVNNGTVTAVKAGTATITVTTADGSKTASCVVTIQPKYTADPEITLTQSGSSFIAIFDSDTPNAMFYYTTNGTEPSIDDNHLADGGVAIVPDGTTLKVIAVADGFAPSNTVKRNGNLQVGKKPIVYAVLQHQ